MEVLRVVIIGAAGFVPLDKTKPVQVTSLPDEVEGAVEICNNNGHNLAVYIIDDHLYMPTKEDKLILKSYPKNVGFYPLKYQDVFHSRCSRVVDREQAVKFESFRDSKEKIIYINIVSNNDLFQKVLGRAKSPYDLAFMVHTETYTDKYFLCFPLGRFSLAAVVNALFQNELPPLYNPVSGEVNSSLVFNEQRLYDPVLYRIIKTGLEQLVWCLKAGYDNLKNDLQVPGWVLQASSPWNQAIIDYYLIAPGVPEIQGGVNNSGVCDQDIQIYMNEYSGYRKTITDCTLSVLSNFVINNQIVTLDQVRQYQGWKSLPLWEHINSIY